MVSHISASLSLAPCIASIAALMASLVTKAQSRKSCKACSQSGESTRKDTKGPWRMAVHWSRNPAARCAPEAGTSDDSADTLLLSKYLQAEKKGQGAAPRASSTGSTRYIKKREPLSCKAGGEKKEHPCGAMGAGTHETLGKQKTSGRANGRGSSGAGPGAGQKRATTKELRATCRGHGASHNGGYTCTDCPQ